MNRFLIAILAVALLSSAACEQKAASPSAVATQAKPSNPSNPIVVIDTSMGTITVELFEDKAPITVKNILAYVDDKFYDGTIFHRVMKDFMIQGGGFEPGMKEKKTRDTIKNESSNGLSNQRGTLAMARTPDPDSASAQFINTLDNFRLDRARADDKVGYCVFGKVLGGMDVVDQIERVRTGTAFQDMEINAKMVKVPHDDVPAADIFIKSIRRAKQ